MMGWLYYCFLNKDFFLLLSKYEVVNCINFTCLQATKEEQYLELFSFFNEYNDKYWSKRSTTWEKECVSRFVIYKKYLCNF